VVVVEIDAADPLRARQHSDHEEQECDRESEPLRRAAEHHADRQQQAAGGEQ
jgi:hypothetical protein